MSNYVIISGSTRAKSNSSKVANYLKNRLNTIDQESKTDILDLSKANIPNWHEGFWADKIPDDNWAKASALIIAADGLIIVSPEWNGMVPPALMNVFLLTSRSELAHKPGLIVTLSASTGGAYPVAELRSYGAKNNQLCYIPDHVIIRDANHVLNSDNSESDNDNYLRQRIDYSLKMLKVYTDAFITIRQSDVIDLESYPYGM